MDEAHALQVLYDREINCTGETDHAVQISRRLAILMPASEKTSTPSSIPNSKQAPYRKPSPEARAANKKFADGIRSLYQKKNDPPKPLSK